MVRVLRGMGILVLMAGIAAYATCSSPRARVADHPFLAGLDGPRPLVIAHRGGAGLWPENTLSAFRGSAALGVDVLEMDLRTTSDGALVVLHDAQVDRTTDGRGPVSELTLREVQALDAGRHFSSDGGRTYPYRGRGVRVPRIGEVFAELGGQRFLVELKEESEASARALCARVREHDLEERVLVASFHADALGAFRRACPRAATAATFGEAWAFYLASATRLLGLVRPRAQALAVFETLGPLPIVTPSFVAHARRLNLPVHVWVVNRPEKIERLLAAGVRGLMTDYPDRLLRVVADRFPTRAGTP